MINQNKNLPFLQALLIGPDAWTVPSLLSRSGFYVDVITHSPISDHTKCIRHSVIVPYGRSMIPAIREKIKDDYDWVSITEDGVLTAVLESNLSLEEKLKALPVQTPENFGHLYSKIGLARTFAKAGVKSPPFYVVRNLSEALAGAGDLGYPVLLKKDSSCGGHGVFECNGSSDLDSISFNQPLLLQKKLPGVELDLSAIYFKGDLIHFSHSRVEKVIGNKFGPSSLRLYRPLCHVEEQIFHELTHIGKALGAHGFTNIGCIESSGERYYFEVDMRANAWINTPRFFGDDPAVRIKNWFARGETLRYPVARLPNQPYSIRIPYFLRLKPIEVVCNRYRVWKFIPGDDKRLMARFLFRNVLYFPARAYLFRVARWIVPKKYRQPVKRIVKRIFRLTTGAAHEDGGN